jgi:hypothetical protein
MAPAMKAHILAADWLGGSLHVLAATAAGLVDLRWRDAIDWTVLDGRYCVGRIGRDGHAPCPLGATVGHEAQCAACAPSWSACVFEPVLHGPGDACTLCQRDHAVYLAMYGTLPKVGMTSAARVETRLREQGADAYFVIQTRRDRLAARQTERTVSTLYGVPERRRHHEILRLLTRPLDHDLVRSRATAWQQRLAERYDCGPLRFLDHSLPVLPLRPHRVEVDGQHVGMALGAKGDHLFYRATGAAALPETGPPVHALQRSALPGRMVEVAAVR